MFVGPAEGFKIGATPLKEVVLRSEPDAVVSTQHLANGDGWEAGVPGATLVIQKLESGRGRWGAVAKAGPSGGVLNIPDTANEDAEGSLGRGIEELDVVAWETVFRGERVGDLLVKKLRDGCVRCVGERERNGA